MSLTPAEAARYAGFILGVSISFTLLASVETHLLRLLIAVAFGVGGGWGASVLYERVQGDASQLTGPLVTEVAKAGDRTAIELLAEVGDWLGVGLANLAAAFDPGAFVIGGGVSAAGDLLIEPARAAFRRQLTGRGFRPEARIVRAELGNEAGMIGAADLARASVLGG